MAAIRLTAFFKEARRRRVFRLAALYIVGAWIALQVTALTFPAFNIPETAIRFVWIGAILGFPLALIFGWRYDWVNGSVVRTAVDGDNAELSLQKTDYIILAASLATVIAITFGIGLELSKTRFNPDQGIRAHEPDPNSIAVLPFENTSAAEENAEFLALGIRDDLLTLLSTNGNLKVVSRTSADRFEGDASSAGDIGNILGVENIVRGSVQRAGNDIHVSVHLIDAGTDKHIWSRQFDNQISVENIFLVQSEIADAIAEALQAKLGSAGIASTSTAPTDDIRAYSLYVTARNNLYTRRIDNIRVSIEEFEEAIARDPQFAEAYAGLAEATLVLLADYHAVPLEEALKTAGQNVNRALQLDPDLPDAYASLGLLSQITWLALGQVGAENVEAERAFKQALALNPNHAQAYMWFASLRNFEQRPDEAIDYFIRSMQLDPLSRFPYQALPIIYARRGQSESAIRLWLDAIDIFPGWPVPYQGITTHLAAMGRLDEAMAWDMLAVQKSSQPEDTGTLAIRIYAEFGDYERARSLTDKLPENHMFAPVKGVIKLVLDGDYTAAIELMVNIIETDKQLERSMSGFASDIALLAGDVLAARKYLLVNNQMMQNDDALEVSRLTVPAIVRLAYILEKEGKTKRSQELLQAALPVVQSMPRLGIYGQGIQDAQIYALLGRTEDAFFALDEAVDEGFRGVTTFDIWSLQNNPFFESIRGDNRFTAIQEELAALNAVMWQRVIEAEASGIWDELLKPAETD